MTNYRKGVRLERLARALLQAAGYTVVRAAGSKGPVDLVAMDSTDLRLIQCKAFGAGRPADTAKLLDFPAPASAVREMWERTPGGWRVTEWRGGDARQYVLANDGAQFNE